MRALIGEKRSMGVEMRELVVGAILAAPPALVNKVALAMILHSVCNRRGRIVAVLAGLFAREKGRIGNFALDPPATGQAGVARHAGANLQALYQLAVLVDPHALFP